MTRPALPAWPAAAVALLTFAAFLPALKNGFVWDDHAMLLVNPVYRRLDWTNLKWLLTTFHMGPYQPLSWASYTLDYQLWGMNPFGYHLTNLLLHSANAALVFFLARRLFAVKHPQSQELNWAAAAAALMFAAHPLRAESVAWATERRDVLSGFFYLAALLFYLRQRTSLAFWTFVCSLLAKGIAVTFPVALIILDIYLLGKTLKESLRGKAPFFLAALAAGIAGYIGQAQSHAMMDAARYGAWARLARGAYGLCFYVSKTFWPDRLLPLYEMPARFNPGSTIYLACGAGVLAGSAALFALRRRLPAAWAAWLFYCVTLFPVLGLVHFGPQIAADRNSYLACLGWPLLTLGFFLKCPDFWKKIGLSAATALIGILAVLTWKQTQIWRSDESLWSYAVAASPEQSIPRNELGQALMALGRMPEALEQFEHAVRLNPDNAPAQYNLGVAFGSGGDKERAAAHYQLALRLRPGYPAAGVNLGMLWASQGKLAQAQALYREVIAGSPNYAPAHLNLGAALGRERRWAEATAEFQEALRIYPRYLEARYNLGQALAAQGRSGEAAEQFQIALRLEPEFAPARQALEKLPQ